MGFVKYLFDIAFELPDHTLLKTFEDSKERVLKGRIASRVSRLVSIKVMG